MKGIVINLSLWAYLGLLRRPVATLIRRMDVQRPDPSPWSHTGDCGHDPWQAEQGAEHRSDGTAGLAMAARIRKPEPNVYYAGPILLMAS
jgi:hypothetical protein